MEQITETMQIHKEWYEQAKKQTLDTLQTFINHLLKDYGHDYGTICHALTAGAIATLTAMNKSKYGGITGFQAGAIMWEFIRNWQYPHNKAGLRLVDYDEMLYPQSEGRFQKTISLNTMEALQKEATANIDKYHADVKEYEEVNLPKWSKDIEAFILKYPDYIDNPDKYNQLGIAKGYEHEARRKAIESGFEEAPYKPYSPMVHPEVLNHWQTIVNGIVPFGHSISEDN